MLKYKVIHLHIDIYGFWLTLWDLEAFLRLSLVYKCTPIHLTATIILVREFKHLSRYFYITKNRYVKPLLRDIPFYKELASIWVIPICIHTIYGFRFRRFHGDIYRRQHNFYLFLYIDMLVYYVEDVNLYVENVLCRSVKRNCTLFFLIHSNDV